MLKNKSQVWQKVAVQKKKQADNAPLFEALRLLRRQIAEQENVPPFVVFADSVLKEMCQACPSTLEELRQVKGIGDVKLRRYGADFLRVIGEYSRR